MLYHLLILATLGCNTGYNRLIPITASSHSKCCHADQTRPNDQDDQEDQEDQDDQDDHDDQDDQDDQDYQDN